MKTGGHMVLSQGRQESVPQIGDGILLVYREPALLQFVDATYVSVRVPFAALSTLASNAGAAAGRRIPRDTEALSLLRAYLANLPERITDPQLGRLSATHIYDLMTLAIGTTAEGHEIASQRGVRAARLEAIKSAVIHDTTISLPGVKAFRRATSRFCSSRPAPPSRTSCSNGGSTRRTACWQARAMRPARSPQSRSRRGSATSRISTAASSGAI
jgi:hypothetical protein